MSLDDPPKTYLDTLTHFTRFLAAYTHSILYLRALYPRLSFLQTRFHDAPVWQSRHPDVCQWICDALAAVRNELVRGTVARIAIVVFRTHHNSPVRVPYNAGSRGAWGSPTILERYIVDVSAFPVVTKAERFMEIEWAVGPTTPSGDEEPEPDSSTPNANPAAPFILASDKGEKPGPKGLDVNCPSHLSENFRAAFIALTTRTSALAPLPPDCSFNISLELKDSDSSTTIAIDAPIDNPRLWMPAQPSLQRSRREAHPRNAEDSEKVLASSEGERKEFSGARVTPVRSIEAGVFRFEAWIEEGRSKFTEVRAERKEV